MNVLDVVENYMAKEGLSGLYCDDCACVVGDIHPCDDDISQCKFGIKINCHACVRRDTCEDYAIFNPDCDYYVVPVGFCDKAVMAVVGHA